MESGAAGAGEGGGDGEGSGGAEVPLLSEEMACLTHSMLKVGKHSMYVCIVHLSMQNVRCLRGADQPAYLNRSMLRIPYVFFRVLSLPAAGPSERSGEGTGLRPVCKLGTSSASVVGHVKAIVQVSPGFFHLVRR